MLIVSSLVAVVALAGVFVLASMWLRLPQKRFIWFLLHFGIGVLGILAVVVLAVLNKLTGTAAAILSGIVSFSIGTASSKMKGGAPPPDSTRTTPRG